MKKINLNISESDSSKKLTVVDKIYYWEKVECNIVGFPSESVSTIRLAIYDEDIQVVKATNFSLNDDNSIYCDFLLQNMELKNALSDTTPNTKKSFTLYVWDESEKEMAFVGSIPIYSNPYIEDKSFENITVLSNFKIQYSSDSCATWSDSVPSKVTHIRFSTDGGKTYDDPISIFLGGYDDTDLSNRVDKAQSTADKAVSGLSKKVDSVDGKQLSTNDYTTDEKNKLAGLSNYDDTAIKASIAAKATSATTLAGYGITDAYTKTEVDSIVGNINTLLDSLNGEVI